MAISPVTPGSVSTLRELRAQLVEDADAMMKDAANFRRCTVEASENAKRAREQIAAIDEALKALGLTPTDPAPAAAKAA